MIIRTRLVSNFTQIPNAVFDCGLEADEVGILAWLLSLPNNWEVKRAHVAKRWNMGRERIARVFSNLIKAGWVSFHSEQAADGKLFSFYEVRNVQEAPSAGQNEPVIAMAADDEEEAQEAAAPATAEISPAIAPPLAADPQPSCSEPASGSTGIRLNRHTANPYRIYNTTSNKTDLKTPPLSPPPHANHEIDAAPPFEELVRSWNSQHILSRIACERVWIRLSVPNRKKALQWSARFQAEAKAKGRKLCDLKTYLNEWRWEIFQKQASEPKQQRFIHRPYTAHWHREQQYLRTTDPRRADFMAKLAREGTGWASDREWPPPLHPDHKSHGPDPPNNNRYLTEDDEQFMAEKYGGRL